MLSSFALAGQAQASLSDTAPLPQAGPRRMPHESRNTSTGVVRGRGSLPALRPAPDAGRAPNRALCLGQRAVCGDARRQGRHGGGHL